MYWISSICINRTKTIRESIFFLTILESSIPIVYKVKKMFTQFFNKRLGLPKYGEGTFTVFEYEYKARLLNE
ncbi:hypothetical protein LBK6_08090 [Leptospira borgpetersenii serovar Hardjo]|nr:hypothetical protein LBK6_08090 [Leptospira borgpetersenii serovar Hardjo]AMX61552.1 hypothetical protein LBK9_08115 [Leptospira borgpetersenii serovar Hardjo]AMX64796.1 hypothetical protein LBK30_08170 [Leptospira borgpetersenii serovar Hardjo]AMX68006.1 hypothetical protein LBHA_07995 [Leptospira borgpetersenii serovar Hardjo]AMX71063.1 hypothetical protein LBHB_07115 [Leptospira borgpetersenii serovar Hardjo]